MTTLYSKPYLSLASFPHEWVNETHDSYGSGGVNSGYILPLFAQPIVAPIHTYTLGFQQRTGAKDYITVSAHHSNPSLRFLPSVAITAEGAFSF